MTAADDEAARLERLWAGEFGDEYTGRNAGAYERRGAFWHDLLDRVPASSVLEVGCNAGGNLSWLARRLGAGAVAGVDINRLALATCSRALGSGRVVQAQARSLPFASESFDLVFTMGVLIHQPTASLRDVMSEVVRTSRRWVLAAEYHAADVEEVSYRGHEGALFRRDYARLYETGFPQLRVVATGFLSKQEGWDDVTWTLLSKGTAPSA